MGAADGRAGRIQRAKPDLEGRQALGGRREGTAKQRAWWQGAGKDWEA